MKACSNSLSWAGIWLCLALGCPHPLSASTLSVGNKSLLFIRLDFPDIPGDPVPQTRAAEVMRTAEDYYRAVSDGKLRIETTFPPTLRMPRSAAWYATHHGERDRDARAAAQAAGFDPARFDLEIMVFDSAVGGGGVGIQGGKGVFLSPPIGFSGVVHELGHNFGLPHNAIWKAWDGTVAGVGMAMAYGDPYDPMGAAGADPRIHFSVRSKVLLGWWGPADIVSVKQSGTYQIYAQDLPGAPGPRALRIQRDAATVYWVEFRQLIAENPFLMNGARILKCYADESGRVDMSLSLLDMMRGSARAPWSTLCWTNASLLLGRTFSDSEAGIHITPVAKKGTSPESLEVVVNLGHYPSNHPPALRLAASTRTPSAGEPVVLRAMTSDPDGDPLEYSWDFGDGSFESGKPEVTHRWKADGDFAVRCSVTDMKGGSVNKLLVVTTGHPALHRLVGTLTANGKPLADVPVVADTGASVFTDTGGSFALTSLAPGRHRISAHTWRCWVAPARIDCPGTDSISLTAVPLLRPDTLWNEPGFELEGGDVLSTPAHFRPPVDITIVAKTSATNLRIGYAANQVIFNWEGNGSELRVDGGPADGQRRLGMGAIPPNQYVTIRWVVTPTSQAIYVNGGLRFRHRGDYSKIDRPVSVFTHQSTVTVKSVRVTRLAEETQ